MFQMATQLYHFHIFYIGLYEVVGKICATEFIWLPWFNDKTVEVCKVGYVVTFCNFYINLILLIKASDYLTFNHMG